MQLFVTAIFSLLIAGIAYFLIQHSFLSLYFDTASEKSNAFQAIFTFLAFAVALLGVVQYVLNSQKKAKLEFKVKIPELSGTHTDIILAKDSIKSVMRIKLYIENNGTKEINPFEAFYFLFVPKELEPRVIEWLGEKQPEAAIHESFPDFVAYGGHSPERIWPKNSILVMTIQITLSRKNVHEILYYMRSSTGYHPSHIHLDKTNKQPVSNLGKLTISIS